MLVDIGFVTGIVMIGIILIGVIGNVLTLFVIICYHPLRDVTGMFLANLAVADLLQSTFGMPLIAVSAFRNQWVFGETLCTISGLTNSLFCISSVLTLTAISVDRWLAIVFPMKYRAWLTVERARIVLVYIWLHALFIAVLPVLGWSRYVYLPYEFLCTVQFEYDKAFTIFATLTCTVIPLIVTVACYSSILRVARLQAREKLPIRVGRFSDAEHAHSAIPDVRVSEATIPDVSEATIPYVSEATISDVSEATLPDASEATIPDVSKTEVVDGKTGEQSKKPGKVVCGNENGAFIADSHSEKLNKGSLSREESKSTVAEYNNPTKQGPSRIVKIFDEEIERDPNHRRHVAGNPETVKERKEQNSVGPSGGNKMSHINPFVVVVAPGNAKASDKHSADPNIKSLCRIGKSRAAINPCIEVNPQREELMTIQEKDRGSAGPNNNSLGRVGKSCVSTTTAGSSAINPWIEENSQRDELMVIPEEDEKTESRKDFVSQIRSAARRRGWMAERGTEDGRHLRKEMKVALILLVVNGTFILCWLPHFIGMMCLVFTDGSCPFPDSFFIITTTLAMLNSGCNPFIYTLTYQRFRKAFRRVLPCFQTDHTEYW